MSNGIVTIPSDLAARPRDFFPVANETRPGNIAPLPVQHENGAPWLDTGQDRAPDGGPMTQVVNLCGTTGDFAGTVDLTWDKVRGARSYIIQMTTTPPGARGQK
jgi:hypothetical protein